MALIIEIENQQKRLPLHLPRIKQSIRKILKLQRISSASLSIAFVVDRKIHAINKKFLNHDYPTDVVTFDWSERRSKNLQGEIVVSAETACRNAKELKTNPQYEIILYLAHGILHLLGYNDHTPKEIRRMRKAEEKIMSHLRIKK